MNPLEGIDPTKLSSEEAAALWLSDGETTDVQKAIIIDENKTKELNMDALAKAGIRRRLGFDFGVKIMPNVILVTSNDGLLLRTRCKLFEGDLNNKMELTNMEAVKRLVEACMKLKEKHDKAIAKNT